MTRTTIKAHSRARALPKQSVPTMSGKASGTNQRMTPSPPLKTGISQSKNGLLNEPLIK